MKYTSFFPDCQVKSITRNQQELIVKLVAHPPQASCPQCQTLSHTVHGHYHRHPKDLPCSEHIVKLELIVTRYRCLNPNCLLKTFSAPLHLLPKQAQRTARLQHIQAQIGRFLSANGGVKLMKVLHMYRKSLDLQLALASNTVHISS
jgi:transposase